MARVNTTCREGFYANNIFHKIQQDMFSVEPSTWTIYKTYTLSHDPTHAIKHLTNLNQRADRYSFGYYPPRLPPITYLNHAGNRTNQTNSEHPFTHTPTNKLTLHTPTPTPAHQPFNRHTLQASLPSQSPAGLPTHLPTHDLPTPTYTD